jgi:hypothetical protein
LHPPAARLREASIRISRADKRAVVDRDLPVMVAFDPTDAGLLTKLNKVMTSPAL